MHKTEIDGLPFLPAPGRIEIQDGELASGIHISGPPEWFDHLPLLARRYKLTPVSVSGGARLPASDDAAVPGNAAVPGGGCTVKIQAEQDMRSVRAELYCKDRTGAARAGGLIIQAMWMLQHGYDWGSGILHIQDAPAFPVRGMHLDVARHFFDADTVMRILDYCAMVGINRFHWHLTDDQGWRLPVAGYPSLTESGAAYTAAEVQRVVAHAASLSITLVPEIDLPGHVQAVLAAVPELVSGDIKGETPAEPWGDYGINPWALSPFNPMTWVFIDRVLKETASLFQTSRIHLGGDECLGLNWQSDPFCLEWAREQGLPEFPMEFDDIQIWERHPARRAIYREFIQRLLHLAEKRGYELELWDDVLETIRGKEGERLPAQLLCWHAEAGQQERARKTGVPWIACPEDTVYFDHAQSDQAGEPGPVHFSPNPINLTDVLAWIPPEDASGVQCCLWTEAVTSVSRLEFMLFPRLWGFAEAAWSGGAVSRREEVARRVEVWTKFHQQLGITVRPQGFVP